MSRSQRIHIDGGMYYVVQRGGRDRPLFRCPQDYGLFERRLSARLRAVGARLHGYCWMPEAIHLIIQVGEVALGRFMQTLASTYARAAGHYAGESGQLFRERYRAALIDPAKYLPRLVRYVHHVPVLCGSTATPADAEHTSHTAHLESSGSALWLTTSATRKVFQSLHDAADFESFMLSAPPHEDVELFQRVEANLLWIIADPEFLQRLPRPHRRYRSRTSLDNIIDTVTCRLGVDREAILPSSRRRDVTLARALIAWYADERGVAKMGEVARYFGRDPSTLSVAIHRHREEHPELFNLAAIHDLVPLVPLSAVARICATTTHRISDEHGESRPGSECSGLG